MRGLTFVHPQNGHQESLSSLAWLWCLIFGVFYLLAKGLWSHALLAVVLIAVAGVMGGGSAALLASIVIWIGYSACVSHLWSRKYLRLGWIQVADESPQGHSCGRRDPHRYP